MPPIRPTVLIVVPPLGGAMPRAASARETWFFSIMPVCAALGKGGGRTRRAKKGAERQALIVKSSILLIVIYYGFPQWKLASALSIVEWRPGRLGCVSVTLIEEVWV